MEQASITPQELYNRERVEGELDLVSNVRTLLVNSGALAEALEYFDTHREIVKAKDKNADAQIFHLNQFFNVQISTISDRNTVDERSVFGLRMRPSDWIKIFEGKILPTLIQYDLPRKL